MLVVEGMTVKLRPYLRSNLEEAVSDGKPHAEKGIKIVCLADMARVFEFVLYFVRFDTVTVSPNQIIILIIIYSIDFFRWFLGQLMDLG